MFYSQILCGQLHRFVILLYYKNLDMRDGHERACCQFKTKRCGIQVGLRLHFLFLTNHLFSHQPKRVKTFSFLSYI